jgi:peptide/nickel transport system permease protein
VLGFHTAAAIGHVVRSNVKETLRAPYIQTARAKGLPERQIILVHVLRAALLPVIAVVALQAGFLLSGTVITESLFVRPGIGRLLLDATIQQDYPIVLGIVVLASVVYAILTFVADLVRHTLDPRVTA